MGDKFLIDEIDWDWDIEPYRLIEIISGVGSGKSTWVEQELMKDKRVLLITSRKAKVQETAIRTGLPCRIIPKNLSATELNDIWGALPEHNGSIVCNNWQIESNLKRWYDPADPKTFLWNYFDVIVVDEVHSLATDATFADAPFHVFAFIKAAYERNPKVKIILLTATPEPIKTLVDSKRFAITDKVVYDKRNECKNVTPAFYHLIPFDLAFSEIKKQYENGDKIIYFTTRTDRIHRTILPRLQELGIAADEIAVSFSNEEKADDFTETLLQNMENVDKGIREHEMIPPNIRVLITTSRYKEGINIKNDDINVVIAESHSIDELRQIWGRVRAGVDKFAIVYDAPQHQTTDKDEFSYIHSKKCKAAVNEALIAYCDEHCVMTENVNLLNNAKALAVINHIESIYPYIRFNVITGTFEWYTGKTEGEENFRQSLSAFRYALNNVEDEGYSYLRSNWFNNKPLKFHHLMKPEYVIAKYFEEKGFLNNVMTPDDIQESLDFLSLNGVRKADGDRYASLGYLLGQYDYQLVEVSKKPNNPKYHHRRLILKNGQ